MGGGQSHAPATLPPAMTRYPLNRRMGGLQGRSGWVRSISSPFGIRPSDRPARSESLYRLSYPGPHMLVVKHMMVSGPKIFVPRTLSIEFCNKKYIFNVETENMGWIPSPKWLLFSFLIAMDIMLSRLKKKSENFKVTSQKTPRSTNSQFNPLAPELDI